MVKEVAKVRNDSARMRIVVIRSEERAEFGVGVEGGTDPSKNITMHLDVRVEKDDDVASGAACPLVTCGCRAQCRRFIDNDDLLRDIECVLKSREATLDGLPPVSGRYDYGNRMHHLILGSEALLPDPSKACAAAITRPDVIGHG